MSQDQLINTAILNNTSHDIFSHAMPFPYIIIDDLLETSTAALLHQKFPSINNMTVKYDGMNERKAEDSSFDRLDPVFTALKERLMQPDITSSVETITGINGLTTIDDRYGRGLHQGGQGSFLDIHVDYNIHPIAKKQRRLNMIIFLNPGWKEEWGGHLEFWNKDVTECAAKILPVFNRCVIFECSNISYHGYEKILCPVDVTRKSFYLYFFSEIQEKMIFHDTIFKTLPGDPAFKKTMVKLKEFTKNSVKRVLYYTGLNRLLK